MNFNKFLKSLFGDKSARDMRLIQPLVEKVKEAYPAIEALSNDELRAKTKEIKQYVQQSAKAQKDKIEELVDEIKKLIEKYEEYKSLSGKEKKQRVDEFIVEWLIENWQSDNDYVQWIIDRVIDLVPVFTQLVYNLLITKFVKLKDRAKTEKAEDK